MNFVDYLFENSENLNKLCLESGDLKLNYPDFHAKVNSLAGGLHSKFGSGKQVLLLSENSPFFVTSYLSIIKSGNTAVLIDTRASKKDLEHILSKCSISCFFIQEKHLSKFNLDQEVYDEKNLDELSFVSNEICVKTNDDDLAVIIFTSGSTGEKKGVMLSHKNLISNTASIVEYLELNEQDKILVTLPLFYCYGASLLHTHLRAGGSVVLSNSIFLGSVIKDINKYQCTGFSGVPSTYQILINKTPFLEQDFPSLRYLTQAGGKLDNKFISMIVDAFPEKQFFTMYGATEATARLSYLPPHLIREKLGSIGKGIPGVKLEVLDEDGNSIHPGEVGEITAVGNNIMKGYLNDHEGTHKKIRDRRLFTGDLATIDKDGFIYIVGRASNFIKSAGYRISPEEISELIIKIKGVVSCVVFGVNDDIMGEAVTAVIQPSSISLEELRTDIISTCHRQLPSYKVPKHLIFVDEFPLNSSNKIDQLKLKKNVEFDIFSKRTKDGEAQ